MISNQPRGRRQTAIRLFAREFYESSLPDGGQGEYDPSIRGNQIGCEGQQNVCCRSHRTS